MTEGICTWALGLPAFRLPAAPHDTQYIPVSKRAGVVPYSFLLRNPVYGVAAVVVVAAAGAGAAPAAGGGFDVT